MIRWTTVILLAVACGPVWAQAPSPAPAADAAAVLAQARKLYSEQGPRLALPEYERALAMFQKSGDQRNEAITLGYIGNCHKRLGDLPKALEFLERALALKQKLGDRLEEGKTLSHLGLVYWEQGEYQQAADVFTRSIAIAHDLGDATLEAAALNNLSLVTDEQGDYRRSLAQYQRALELERATHREEDESFTLGNIGGVYLNLGNFREAMKYYQQALAISERLNLKASASDDLGNLALCQLGVGQPEEALRTFDRALALAREAGLKKEEADWHRGKGDVHFTLGRYDKAREEYRTALEVYEQAGLKRELVEALSASGNLHVLLGDLASSENSYRRAIELARAIGNARGVTTNLAALGDLERRRKRLEPSRALYREALQRAREADDRGQISSVLAQLAFVDRDMGRNEDAAREAAEAVEVARQAGARLLEAQALYARGEVERAQARHAEALQQYDDAERVAKEIGDPELGWRIAFGRGQTLEALGRDADAVAAYVRAVEIIESVQSELREERFRAGYLEDKFQVYVALVRLLLKLGRPGDAFQFSERLRARSYLELLNRGLPPIQDEAQRRAEAELRARIRHLQLALEQEATKPAPEKRERAVEMFSHELVDMERAYQNLLDDLRLSQPAYAAVRALEIPSTAQVQSLLPPATALVEYVVGSEGVSIFVLTARELKALVSPVRAADLAAKVELFRSLIVQKRADDWRPPATSLRRLLIDPIEQAGWLAGVERLYIVPHGILHYLPFAALPRSSERGVKFLAEEYVLANLPAATALVYGKGAAQPRQNLLALAPARARLLFAESEARSISRFFPHQPMVLVGAQATESSFKKHAPDFGVIHLASHGFLNKLNPLFSGVELEADRNEDGRLQVFEILRMRLHASLVTLSACDTALGSGYFADVPAGEDFVGLTRAFLFAGTPSVLASLWEVNDQSTAELMQGFYRHLARTDKATALALAQRAMLRRGGRFAHPSFWAPFVLVGAMK